MLKQEIGLLTVDLSKKLKTQITLVDEQVEKLDNLKPINNNGGSQKQEFLQKVASKLEDSHRLKD